MNRPRSLLTAGFATAISAAAIAATAAAQGVFDTRTPVESSAGAQAAPATTARELEPLIGRGGQDAANPVPGQPSTSAPADASPAASSRSSTGDGRHGADDGPLHDINDDHGGDRDDDDGHDADGESDRHDDDDDHDGSESGHHGGDHDDDDRSGSNSGRG